MKIIFLILCSIIFFPQTLKADHNHSQKECYEYINNRPIKVKCNRVAASSKSISREKTYSSDSDPNCTGRTLLSGLAGAGAGNMLSSTGRKTEGTILGAFLGLVASDSTCK